MVFEASQNWERNSRYPINLRVMVIKLPQGEKFRENALTHGNKTQVEMASLWEGEISARTISRALKKIGTRKKKLTAFQERDEVKRKAFIANLSSVDLDRIVYLDESAERSAPIGTIVVGIKEASASMHSSQNDVRGE